MNKSLGGWQRIGVIGAVVWVLGSPLVIGPFAKANSEACATAAMFEPGGEYAGMAPGALNTKYPKWMEAQTGPSYLPDPEPLVCLGGFENYFDLRDYPFGDTSASGLMVASVIAALVLLLEAGLILLLVWAAYNVVAGVIRWVRAGFASADDEAKG